MLHLHNNYSFTESLVETVIRSLRHSCRSELTRQGTSLSYCYSRPGGRGAGHFCRPLHVAMQLGLYLHPPGAGAWRTVSEDSGGPRPRPFLLIICTHRVVTHWE